MMNEHIAELIEQAGLDCDECAYLQDNIAKFASLILNECEQAIKSVPTTFEAQDKIVVECLKAIRVTFRS